MRYREFIGTRLLAILVLVPAMFYIALGLEGSNWWPIACRRRLKTDPVSTVEN